MEYDNLGLKLWFPTRNKRGIFDKNQWKNINIIILFLRN